MGFTAGTVALITGIAGLAATGIGMGMQYSAQKSAAKTQAEFGLLNAQAQAQQARLQGRQAMLSAEIQAASARAGQQSANNNAAALRKQAEAESITAQENIRRSRDSFARTLGKIRAGYSESGVLETTGSPLDFLVKATEDEQLYESELRWQDEVNRRNGYRAADVEEMSGRGLGLNASLFKMQGQADIAASKVASSQARMGGYAALADASATRAGASAGLISGIGGMATSAYQLYQNRTPRTPKPKAYYGPVTHNLSNT